VICSYLGVWFRGLRGVNVALRRAAKRDTQVAYRGIRYRCEMGGHRAATETYAIATHRFSRQQLLSDSALQAAGKPTGLSIKLA